MDNRGQTTLDFTIGISIFLAVILFIFLFAPGILTPFTVTGQSEAVTVDRTADLLVQDKLGDPEQPYKLDRGCTVAFLNRSSAEASPDTEEHDCRFSDDEGLNEQLGLGEFQTANITILGTTGDGQESTQLYWDRGDRELVESESEASGEAVSLRVGEEVEQRRATTTATRIVTLNGKDVTMRVIVA